MKQAKSQKRPQAAKASPPPEDQEDALALDLVELALDLRALDEYTELPEALKKKNSDFRKIIRKCLQQEKDATLNEALERAFEEDERAFAVLKAALEDMSGTVVQRRESETVVQRRDSGADIEVNAFVIPIFVRSLGGLRSAQNFQDEAAFELLRESLQEGELESRRASVVLVSHAYHRDEIEAIGYSQLNAMVHEAYEAMTRKKAAAAPAIARSMRGWPESRFAPDDHAVELRFLLGFALKTLDDPFYAVPAKEAAADRYFDARAQRFQRWSKQVVPLLQRCLVTDGREVEIDFLYQDLFYGGKATAFGEHGMLEMMSALQQALQEQGVAPAAAHAVIGPADVDEGMVLRVCLYAGHGGALLASAEKPIGHGNALQAEADDIHDALHTLGVQSLSLALKFDADGQPVDMRPYQLR